VPQRSRGTQHGPRLLGIDAARTIAAAGTVWVHSIRDPNVAHLNHIGRFAVPFFAFIAAWFMVAGLRKDPRKPFTDHVSNRFDRIYAPFLFWSVVYFLARELKGWLFPEQLAQGAPVVQPLMAFSGTAPHLWFLPFLFLWLVVSYLPMQWAVRNRWRQITLGGALIAFGYAMTQVRPDEVGLTFEGFWDPRFALVASWERSPAFLWGLAAGLLIEVSPGRVNLGRRGTVFGLALTIFCLGAMVITSTYSSLLQCLAGFGWVIVALGWWPRRLAEPLVKLATYSYGVYLCHLLFAEALRPLRIMLGMEQSLAFDLVRFCITLVFAFITAILMRRWWATRWLIP